jgi:hypothetical protein
MSINNPGYEYEQLTPIIEKLLGDRTTQEQLDEFPYEIYRFIIRSLRDRDQNEGIGGTRLLERYLKGPQEIWGNLFRAGSNLQVLFSAENIPYEFLPSLARLVGFGRDMTEIIGLANEEELRKIVAGAINYWFHAWLNFGIASAIRLVTGNRFKIRDFFDFRFIVGETSIEEDLKNTDPNMISVKTRSFFIQGTDGIARFDATPYTFATVSQSTKPKVDHIGGFIVIFDDLGSPTLNGLYQIVDVDIPGEFWIVGDGDFFARSAPNLSWFIAFPYDEYLTEIRVVDEKTGDGEVNRDLLEKLLIPQRPHGERFNVVYVDFMDLFQVNGDIGMWEDSGYGTVDYSVGGGVLRLECTDSVETGIKTNRSTASGWDDYQWKVKLALSSNGTIWLGFYDDNYRLEITYSGFGTGYVRLWRKVATVWGSISAQIPWPDLNLETFWTYTIEILNIPSGNVDIKIAIDGNVVIHQTTTQVVSAGNVYLLADTSSSMEVEETELWVYPLDISRIGPNP